MKDRFGGSSFKCDIRKQQSKDGSGQMKHALLSHNVVILYPSMCCPAILDPDRKNVPLSLIIATDERFYSDYQSSEIENGPDKSGWEFRKGVSRVIARFIKIQEWVKGSGAKKDTLSLGDTLLGECVNETVTLDTLRNFACTYLGEIGRKIHHAPYNENMTNTSMCAAPGNIELLGLMREDTVSYYRGRFGLKHLFEIQLHGLNLTAGSLYEVSWVIKGDEPPTTYNQYYEQQDKNTLDYLSLDPRIPPDLRNKGFHIDAKGINYTPVDSVPLENHHFVWVAPNNKPRLDIGHLTDVHVSSRQSVFKKSKAQLIPEVSPQIGPLTHACFDALKDLMDQFGHGANAVDVLIFTGDLIDYNRNYNPQEFDKTSGKSGDIWQEMSLKNLNVYDPDKKEQVVNSTKYPRSIDNVTMYSLFLYYYKTYGKPILLTSGNHEGYTLPYGISPRVQFWRSVSANMPNSSSQPKSEVALVKAYEKQAEKNQAEVAKKGNPDIYFQRANDGVPADHNLTITEATLMYGPDYAGVLASGAYVRSGEQNFNKANYDWFYTLFTPLSDFVLSYKDQLFLGLDWGEGEKMVAVLDAQTDGFFGGGILPRATASLNKPQLNLINQAVNQPHACKLLLSHFTLVNFNYPIPLTDTGAVHFGPNGKPAQYDLGTFENNRDALYKPFTLGKFGYTLSGHSHRAALYYVAGIPSTYTDLDNELISMTAPVRGMAAKVNGQVRSYATRSLPDTKTRTIVSACGGPISAQNFAGELGGMGLDYPSGSFIRFSATQEQQVGVIIPRAKVKTAKPRLAVALDYTDIVKGDPVFTRFEAQSFAGPFQVKINSELKLPTTDIIASAKIVLFVGSDKSIVPLSKTSTDADATILSISGNTADLLNAFKRPERYTCFIEIQLSKSVLTGEFSHYDISTPWTYRIELGKRTEKVFRAKHYVSQTIDGYLLGRHKDWGEIADHRWYSANFGAEYAYPWKSNQKSDEDNLLNS